MSDESNPVEVVETEIAPKRRGRPRKVEAVATVETAPPQVALTFDQLKELLAMGQASKSSSPELELALAGIQATIAQTAKLTGEVERTTRKSNAHGQDVSVFTYKPSCAHCQSGTAHPENNLIGHPKDDLRFDTYWPKGCKVIKDDATVLEIELLNQFDKSRTARDGSWTATVTKKGGRGTLVIDAPTFYTDDRNSLPPLPQILMELLHGPEQSDPTQMIDRMLAMQKQIDELKAAQSVPA